MFDPTFILTLDREYDENKNYNYVFLYLYITFQATMITTKYSQLSNGKWTILLEWIWFTIRYHKIKRHTTQTSIKNDISHVTGSCCVKYHRRTQSQDFEELCLGIFKVLFCKYTNRITRPYYQKFKIPENDHRHIKIMYIKTNTNKIHEIQNVKFLEN